MKNPSSEFLNMATKIQLSCFFKGRVENQTFKIRFNNRFNRF